MIHSALAGLISCILLLLGARHSCSSPRKCQSQDKASPAKPCCWDHTGGLELGQPVGAPAIAIQVLVNNVMSHQCGESPEHLAVAEEGMRAVSEKGRHVTCQSVLHPHLQAPQCRHEFWLRCKVAGIPACLSSVPHACKRCG